MKLFDTNYKLLDEMYQDDYYPTFLVDKVKDELQKVIDLLESGETDIEVVQEKLDASTQTPVQGKTRRGEPGPDDLIEPLHPQDLVLNELPQLQGESLAFIKYIKKF